MYIRLQTKIFCEFGKQIRKRYKKENFLTFIRVIDTSFTLNEYVIEINLTSQTVLKMYKT